MSVSRKALLYAVIINFCLISSLIYGGTQNWDERQKITVSDVASHDYFGRSVSMSGDYAIIGASTDDTNGTSSGSAYIFVRNGNTWTQQAKLTAADGAASDYFGHSVCISGDYAVIGAFGNDDAGNSSGSAYVFIRNGTTWSQQAKLTASDAQANDEFGRSVSISGDYLIIGAYRNSESGSAYVFTRSGTTWTQQTKLTASDAAAGDCFGVSVAISSEYALIGAYDDGAYVGSAYVFVRSGASWTQQAKLTASDAASNDYFGLSVSISGSYAIVGAYGNDDAGSESGSAYVFLRNGTSWSQQAKLTASDAAAGDYFGNSVFISGDQAIVGAYGDGANDSGSAYIYSRSGSSWSQQTKLTASDASNYDYFGKSLCLSGDLALVGAYGKDNYTGSAYLFRHGINVRIETTTGGYTDRDGDNTVVTGDDFTVTAFAAESYAFTNWTGDASGSANPLTINNVTSDLTITPVFQMLTGTLVVDLEAGASGGSYTIRGPAAFNNGKALAGQTSDYLEVVPVGTYVVTFTQPANWNLSLSATSFSIETNTASGHLTPGNTETVRGNYNAVENGRLQVTLNPQGTGSKWRFLGEKAWHESGEMVTDIAPGTYTITCSNVLSYKTPSDFQVVIKSGKLTAATRKYQRILATVLGQLKDHNGEALPNHTVYLNAENGEVSRSTRSDAAGKFQFKKTPAVGSITVSPGQLGGTDLVQFLFKPDKKKLKLTQSKSYSAGTFQATIRKGEYEIKGIVSSTAGNPIKGAKVSIINGPALTTSETGLFTFKRLYYRDYQIRVTPPRREFSARKCSLSGYKGKVLDKSCLEIRARKTGKIARVKDYASFVFAPIGLSIKGTIYKDNTTPVTWKQKVSLYKYKFKNGNRVEELIQTKVVNQEKKDSGRYFFTNLTNGKYLVRVDASQRSFKNPECNVSLEDDSITNIDFFLDTLDNLDNITLNGVTIWADKFTYNDNGSIKASGHVRLCKNKIISCPDVIVDPENKIITGEGNLFVPDPRNMQRETSDSWAVQSGKFVLNAGNENQAGLIIPVSVERHFIYKGVYLQPLEFYVYDDYIECKAQAVKLEIVGGIQVYPNYDNESYAWFVNAGSATYQLNKLKLFFPGPIKIYSGAWLRNLTFSFDKKKKDYAISGDLFCNKKNTDLWSLHADVRLKDGKIDYVNCSTTYDIQVWKNVWLDYAQAQYFKNHPDFKRQLVELYGILAGRPNKNGYNVITGDFTAYCWNDGSFSAWGDNFRLMDIPLDGMANVWFNPNRSYLEIAGRAKLKQGPASFNGKTNAKMYYGDYFGVDGSISTSLSIQGVKLASISAWFKTWNTIGIKATAYIPFSVSLAGSISNGKLHITSPSAIASLFSLPSVDTPNNFNKPGLMKDECIVSDGLDEVQFLFTGKKAAPEPVITSPGGWKIDSSSVDPLVTYEQSEKYCVTSVRILSPQGGNWRVKVTNSKNSGTFSFVSIEYPKTPAVSIEKITDIGGNVFSINLNRSHLPGEKLNLFYSKNAQGTNRKRIASSEQIGNIEQWEWDASSIPAGDYFLIASVRDEHNPPFMAVSEQPVTVIGELPPRPAAKPSVKIRNKELVISWDEVVEENLSGYKVYIYDLQDNNADPVVVPCDYDWKKLNLSHKLVKPGRKYRLAITATYNNGQESAPSPARTFKYKLKKGNNIPFFTSAPKDSVFHGRMWKYSPAAKDYDGDALAFTLLKGPEGMTLDRDKGLLSWKPETVECYGRNEVILMVSDSQGDNEVQKFTLFVRNEKNAGDLNTTMLQDSTGHRRHVISYWNPDLNTNNSLRERLTATVSLPGHGKIMNLTLVESALKPGFFVGEITDSTLLDHVNTNARIAAQMGAPFIVSIQGKEKTKRILQRK